MSWIKDFISPKTRKWEEFYRNRWQHDKVVRRTHGANCTGGCSWNIYVKNGMVVWETQALDYPEINENIPPYEPRGCQRGISASWYLYSPLRIKYPMIRGRLLDLYEQELKNTEDPYKAWENLQNNPEKRALYQNARGKGGFRRISWEKVQELIAVANIYTVKKYGPDRLCGFSPIPAMSMISYAAGSRFLQLMGGVNLSFYDWYCDLPNCFPETWGEQTDVAESADWFNSKFIAVMGSNPAMTRTPDVHFFAEAKHNGTKTVVFSPDFSMVAKYSDEWLPIHAGMDGAFWMAVSHVILTEYHYKNTSAYFVEYLKKYSDCPYLIELENKNGKLVPGKLLRANRILKYQNVENGEWKFLNIDENTGELICPAGSVGHRWGTKEGLWNTCHKDGETQENYSPVLTLIKNNDGFESVEFTEFAAEKNSYRDVPVKKIKTIDGETFFTTVYDLIMAQYGVNRGLDGDYPKDYNEEAAYTPAWQEKFTGIGAKTVISFAREWAKTAVDTEGKCMIIIGAGVNQWYHGNLIYRAAAVTLMITGCVGKNGGGMNHYVGQEKLAPVDSWGAIMSAKDWQSAARLQQTPIWHYINSDQWRYDANHSAYAPSQNNDLTGLHTSDLIFKSVRNGWMPFYPQYNTNNFDLFDKATESGAKSEQEIRSFIINKLKQKELKYSIEDPDDESNFPRVWYIWRGNAIMSSAKGHEFFLKHYLGTHNNVIAEESAKGHVKEVKWHENAPTGKMDLIVDLNFRMDTSALYSDIVLPAATWYEKSDLNSTDMHSFIHPLSAAVKPSWEAKTDWAIFKDIAKATSETAKKYFNKPVTDIVNTPIMHDTPGEISQSKIKDWFNNECEAVPGKSMHNIVFVKRDYTKIHDKFISLGDGIKNGLGAHGNSFKCEDFYEELLDRPDHIQYVDGVKYPSIKEDEESINAILALSSLTNGELANRAYKNAEKRTGQKLTDISEGKRDVRLNFANLQAQPQRYNDSPVWSGIMKDKRTYSAFTYNVERFVPWRTLTGRQHFYLDHDGYIAFGENLPTFKPGPKPEIYGDLKATEELGKSKVLNVLTPHGKWQIHSTYSDTPRMQTLSRGMVPCWISEADAKDLEINDNDWIELFNDNGVYCTRVIVSSRIPKGVCFVYHSPERTYTVPKSEIRKNKRAGAHNSLTRVRLKPNLLMGGYGQFTYHFNYWGPVGVNRDSFVRIKKMNKVVF